MANELEFLSNVGTLTKARIFSADGTTTWNGTAMVTASGLSSGDYGTLGVVTLSTDTDDSGIVSYLGDFPAGLTTAGVYTAIAWVSTPTRDSGASGPIRIYWDGAAQITPSSLQTQVNTIQAGIVAISATLTETSVPQVNLEMAKAEDRTFQITFTDSDGDPVSFQGDTMSCVVSTIRGTTAISEIACTVATTNYNAVSIPVQSTDNATVGTFKYDLWNETDTQRIAYGAFVVSSAVSP